MRVKLKAAVIGVGSMGQHHARVYSELDQTDLVAVADISFETATRIASRHGVPAYVDYRKMLERERPDLVSVAVPTRLHQEIAEAAMEAGVHVLVEKPIAATAEDGKALVAAAESFGRQLMVGHVIRFNPANRLLKEFLSEGRLGKVFQIVCRRVGPFPARIRDVGVVVDLATHDLDLMCFLLEDEPVRVFAQTGRQIHTEHEDLLLALMSFRKGTFGMLEANWLTPTKVREILVLGERGMVQVDDLTQDFYFYENAQAGGELWGALHILKGVSEGRMVRYEVPRGEPLKAELEAFVAAVLNNEPSPVSGEEGLAALRLALALVESGRKHKVVNL